MGILDKLKSEILLFDGAMGTMLQNQQLDTDVAPEIYNITHPSLVQSIHEEYVFAGADIITANTFQANALKLPKEYNVSQVIKNAIAIAKSSGANYVAQTIGPLGQLFYPLGEMTFDKAYQLFKEQVVAGQQAGADCILIETFGDLYEAKIAVLAAKENAEIPVFCTMSFEQNGRTFLGTDAQTATLAMQGLGVDTFGANCSLGPKELLPVVNTILQYAKVPVMVQPNAGLPTMQNGQPTYNISPKEYRDYVEQMLDSGVSIIGGCCGTNSEFIRRLNMLRKEKTRAITYPHDVTAASSINKLIDLRESLNILTILPETDSAESSVDMALDMVDLGANILGGDFSDSEVIEIQGINNTPLMFFNTDITQLKNSLRVYQGKPLVCVKQNIQEVLPAAKKYSATLAVYLEESNSSSEEYINEFLSLQRTVKESGFPPDNILAAFKISNLDKASVVIETLERLDYEYKTATLLDASDIQNTESWNDFLQQALGRSLNVIVLDFENEKFIEIAKRYI